MSDYRVLKDIMQEVHFWCAGGVVGKKGNGKRNKKKKQWKKRQVEETAVGKKGQRKNNGKWKNQQ
jgi:hypothetical protein